ncbi:ubiquitin-ubiquitin ligase HUL5 Ecym_3375 [Eremothecium cymbalariae DBVPG|uniref:HECT-type E3 ubiquitin transferase n=1 Tax=Eremothecium cymbalariae (strain CBS 270.75 / DBVPG 7215 / KCTC 17166 / NRRL Y-17582) TaxID=931890 RepID=G8JRU3_ERECY|nr:Hypothetical protein Ecym_3375 [Eremothecium cymbalariae DBVPG\
MLNFNGSTKRRNVNLGSRSQVKRTDLIERAKIERERRAEEKKSNEAAILIQKTARQWLIKKKVFAAFLKGTNIHVYRLIVAFSPSIFYFTSKADMESLIKQCSIDDATVYWKATRLLELSPVLNIPNDLIQTITFKLNNSRYDPLTPPIPQRYSAATKLTRSREIENIIQSRLSIMQSSTGILSDDFLEQLLEVVPNERVFMDFEAIKWSSLYTMDHASVRRMENLTNWLKKISKILCPEIVLLQEQLSDDIIYYMVFLFADLNGPISSTICSVICSCMSKNKSFKFDSENYFFSYVEKLYSYSLASILCEFFHTKSVLDASVYARTLIKNAPSPRHSQVLLLGLVADNKAMDSLIKGCNNNEDVNEDVFLLLVECLDVYLLYVGDTTFLGPRSSFLLEYVIKFCKLLKFKIIELIMGHQNEYDSFKMHNFLSLAQKLHARSSRSNFLPFEETYDFWVITNNTIQRCDLTEVLLNFDDYYRKELDALTGGDDNKFDALNFDRRGYENSIKEKFFELKSPKNAPWGSLTLRKLDILLRAPFLIPFNERVSYFEKLIQHDNERLHSRSDLYFAFGLTQQFFPNGRRQRATISRSRILEDAYEAFNPIGEAFKEQLAVTFVNEFGPEVGIDGGGITKEFLTSISDEGFNKDKYGLFESNSSYELYPSDTATSPLQLKYLQFLGKILGKCLYEKVLIDVNFADFFLHKLLNTSKNMVCSFDNLSSFDQELYDNLNKLFDMTNDELLQLDLRMELFDNATKKFVELIPGGSDIPVSVTNVRQYAMAIASYKINAKLYKPTLFFQTGMSTIIPPHWISIFSSREISNLISGGGKDIDLSDLKANVTYGGYVETDKTIQDLWQLLIEFTPEERCKFIKFATSVPRAPLLGFQMLNPNFGIHNAGRDGNRLPTASTCVNLLKLPDYQDKNLLREKLLYAINAEARFDLS